MSSIPYTVVIVTKNRKQLLLGCLLSLLAQPGQPAEIVVVDNQSNDGTFQTIKLLAKHITKKIRIVTEQNQGYPIIYNRGLQEAKTAWVAFIDDDCIAHPGWLEAVEEAITKYPQAAAILGKSETVFIDNVWSMTQFAIDSIWKAHSILGKKVLNYKILDNKNIVYNKNFLSSHALAYDVGRIGWASGSGEDCDLGMQIQQAQGKAYYVSNIQVWHHDLTTARAFFSRLVSRALGYTTFQVKWRTYYRQNLLRKNSSVHTGHKLFKLKKAYHLSWPFFIQVVLVFCSAMAVSYSFKILEQVLVALEKYQRAH